jgi:hypothetical protein
MMSLLVYMRLREGNANSGPAEYEVSSPGLSTAVQVLQTKVL